MYDAVKKTADAATIPAFKSIGPESFNPSENPGLTEPLKIKGALAAKMRDSQLRSKPVSLPGSKLRSLGESLNADVSGVHMFETEGIQKNLGASALSVGNEIHFGSGNFHPESESGMGLIGHELSHVVSVAAGSPVSEKTADVQGLQAARGASAGNARHVNAAAAEGSDTVHYGPLDYIKRQYKNFKLAMMEGQEQTNALTTQAKLNQNHDVDNEYLSLNERLSGAQFMQRNVEGMRERMLYHRHNANMESFESSKYYNKGEGGAGRWLGKRLFGNSEKGKAAIDDIRHRLYKGGSAADYAQRADDFRARLDAYKASAEAHDQADISQGIPKFNETDKAAILSTNFTPNTGKMLMIQQKDWNWLQSSLKQILNRTFQNMERLNSYVINDFEKDYGELVALYSKISSDTMELAGNFGSCGTFFKPQNEAQENLREKYLATAQTFARFHVNFQESDLHIHKLYDFWQMDESQRPPGIQFTGKADDLVKQVRVQKVDPSQLKALGSGAINQVYSYNSDGDKKVFKPGKRNLGMSLSDVHGFRNEQIFYENRFGYKAQVLGGTAALSDANIIAAKKSINKQMKKQDKEAKKISNKNVRARKLQENAAIRKVRLDDLTEYQNLPTEGRADYLMLNADTSKRDVAISRLSKSLGFDNMSNGQLVRGPDGRMGLMMNRAQGDQAADHIYTSDKLKGSLNKKDRAAALNFSDPALQSEFIKLAIVDVIASASDRHGNNFFIDKKEGGGYNLQGIDSDLSFTAKKEYHKEKGDLPENIWGWYTTIERGIPYVTQEIADRVRSLDTERLTPMLTGMVMENQIEEAKQRLKMLQSMIGNEIPIIDNLDEAGKQSYYDKFVDEAKLGDHPGSQPRKYGNPQAYAAVSSRVKYYKR